MTRNPTLEKPMKPVVNAQKPAQKSTLPVRTSVRAGCTQIGDKWIYCG